MPKKSGIYIILSDKQYRTRTLLTFFITIFGFFAYLTFALAIPCAQESDFAYIPKIGKACFNPHTKLYHVKLISGKVIFTHGPDDGTRLARGPETPAGEGAGVAAAAPRNPVCASTTFMYVIYAVPNDRTNRYSTYAETIRGFIKSANGLLYAESSALGNGADYRVYCNAQGAIHVAEARLNLNSSSARDMGNVVDDLVSKGYTSTNAKYNVFVDTANDCQGIADLYIDETRDVNNANNQGPRYALSWAAGCSSDATRWLVMMHENGHNMGAVQYNAPESSGNGYHCNDGHDIMCYADGGDKSNYRIVCSDRQYFDCNHNTYFHPNAASGYLTQNWQVGWTSNRFLNFSNSPATLTINAGRTSFGSNVGTGETMLGPGDSFGMRTTVGSTGGTTRIGGILIETEIADYISPGSQGGFEYLTNSSGTRGYDANCAPAFPNHNDGDVAGTGCGHFFWTGGYLDQGQTGYVENSWQVTNKPSDLLSQICVHGHARTNSSNMINSGNICVTIDGKNPVIIMSNPSSGNFGVNFDVSEDSGIRSITTSIRRPNGSTFSPADCQFNDSSSRPVTTNKNIQCYVNNEQDPGNFVFTITATDRYNNMKTQETTVNRASQLTLPGTVPDFANSAIVHLNSDQPKTKVTYYDLNQVNGAARVPGVYCPIIYRYADEAGETSTIGTSASGRTVAPGTQCLQFDQMHFRYSVPLLPDPRVTPSVNTDDFQAGNTVPDGNDYIFGGWDPAPSALLTNEQQPGCYAFSAAPTTAQTTGLACSIIIPKGMQKHIKARYYTTSLAVSTSPPVGVPIISTGKFTGKTPYFFDEPTAISTTLTAPPVWYDASSGVHYKFKAWAGCDGTSGPIGNACTVGVAQLYPGLKKSVNAVYHTTSLTVLSGPLGGTDAAGSLCMVRVVSSNPQFDGCTPYARSSNAAIVATLTAPKTINIQGVDHSFVAWIAPPGMPGTLFGCVNYSVNLPSSNVCNVNVPEGQQAAIHAQYATTTLSVSSTISGGSDLQPLGCSLRVESTNTKFAGCSPYVRTHNGRIDTILTAPAEVNVSGQIWRFVTWAAPPYQGVAFGCLNYPIGSSVRTCRVIVNEHSHGSVHAVYAL